MDLLKNVFFAVVAFFSCNILDVIPLKYVSMNNQECKIRTKIIDIKNSEPSFYHYSIEINKCRGSCNNINDPYAKLCVPDVVKNINVKVLNLMSRTNETRHIECHEPCKCKYRLDASVCDNKQRKGFLWNPNNCECDKSCDVGEYLDYENCNCRKKLVDKLVEECSEEIDGNEMIYNATLNDYENVCDSCTIYIVYSFLWWYMFIFIGI